MDIPRHHVIRESDHRIHNAFSPEKLAHLGEVLQLRVGARLLDLASGSGEMLVTWARDHGITGVGVDLCAEFTMSAVARADELGVSDQVTFVHREAAAYVAGVSGRSFDVVSCLGATWIGGGPLGILDLLERLLKPGGIALIGEPFWIRTPETPKAVLGSHATSVSDFTTLPGLVGSFQDHGWDLVQMVLASPDDWDRYQAAQWFTTRRWLDENPHDEMWAQMRAELDERPLNHVTFSREHLGWGAFALMKR